jgi:dihydrolipoamide dehydrogenase
LDELREIIKVTIFKEYTMAIYDVAIIGSGPGGYVSAIRSAQLGLKTALIERDAIGGVCLNWGCIPTKALLEAASNMRSADTCARYNIKIDKSSFEYGSVYRDSRLASERLAGGIKHLLAKNKVAIYNDFAKILPSGAIYLESSQKTIESKNVIIATGSREKELPFLPFDGKHILSSKDALSLKELPKEVVIIGAGAIGVEFSQIFNSFGVKVTLVEMLNHILPLEDEEISSELEIELKSSGIHILTNTKITAATEKNSRIELQLSQGDSRISLNVEKVLVAIGRTANIEGLGLEESNIKTSKGFIETNDFYETSRKAVYAIGDVVGQALLAHAASAQGLVAIEHIAGHQNSMLRKIDIHRIPKAVYCEPQLASFGLTQKMAMEQGLRFSVGKFPFIGCGKAVATGKTSGIVKIIVDTTTKEILGATILGANATELIHELLLAKNSELVPEDIINLIHAHPTYSETLQEAAKAVFGKPIHI